MLNIRKRAALLIPVLTLAICARAGVIPSYPSAGTLTGVEKTVVEQSSSTKSATTAQIARAPGGVVTAASASLVDLGALAGQFITITGSATITSFGSTAAAGTLRYLTFTGSATLTYNATSMIFPGATDLSMVPGDGLLVESLGSGNWQSIGSTCFAAVNDGASALGATVCDALNSLASDAHPLAGTASEINVSFGTDGPPSTVTLSTPQPIDTSSDPTFRDLTIRHLEGSGSAPTVSVVGSGAGTCTSSCFTITGTDTDFNVTVVAGASPAGSSANVVKLAFASNYTVAPLVTVTAANRLTAALQAATTTAWSWNTVTTSSFIISSGTSTGLTASGTYSWNVSVRGK